MLPDDLRDRDVMSHESFDPNMEIEDLPNEIGLAIFCSRCNEYRIIEIKKEELKDVLGGETPSDRVGSFFTVMTRWAELHNQEVHPSV